MLPLENLRLPFLGTQKVEQTNKQSDYEFQSKIKSYEEEHVILQDCENIVYSHYNINSEYLIKNWEDERNRNVRGWVGHGS